MYFMGGGDGDGDDVANRCQVNALTLSLQVSLPLCGTNTLRLLEPLFTYDAEVLEN